MAKCSEYDSLSVAVERALKQLSEKTTILLELFRAKNDPSFRRLDKELELLVGEKERAIGALRQHVKDHGCQQTI